MQTDYYAHHYDDLHREGKLANLVEDAEFDLEAAMLELESDDWEKVEDDGYTDPDHS